MRMLFLLLAMSVLEACGSGPEGWEVEGQHPKVNKPIDCSYQQSCDRATVQAY